MSYAGPDRRSWLSRHAEALTLAAAAVLMAGLALGAWAAHWIWR